MQPAKQFKWFSLMQTRLDVVCFPKYSRDLGFSQTLMRIRKEVSGKDFGSMHVGVNKIQPKNETLLIKKDIRF